MTSIFDLAVQIGDLLGVPLAVLFTIACFVIRDLCRRLNKLELEIQAIKTHYDNEIKQLRESHKQELNAIYEKINPMAEGISFIKGWIEGKRDDDK